MKRAFLCACVISLAAGCGGGAGGGVNRAAVCPSLPRPYTPAIGRAAGATEGQPGARRLLLATSPDGGIFTRAERVLLDQANTPNALVDAGGAVRVYYTGANVDGAPESIAVAVSCDGGASWRYGAVTIDGLPPGPPAGDPDVVVGSDGAYTLYFTRVVGAQRVGVHRARSADGFAFTYEGVALEVAGGSVLDSLTARVGGEVHMYTLTGTTEAMTHATSGDGATFTAAPAAEVRLDGAAHVLANWQAQAGGAGQRIWGFSLARNQIRSFLTSDGTTLAADATVHLSFPGGSALESRFAIDPAVVRLADGTSLMAYVSLIP